MSHLCFKRNFWDKGIVHTKMKINYPSKEYKRRHFEEFVVPKMTCSNLICSSAYLDMVCLNTHDFCYHSHQTCTNSLKVWNMRMHKWDLWAPLEGMIFIFGWTISLKKQLRTWILLSSKRATSEHYFFPSGYMCVWSENPASRQAKMWHPGLKEGSRAYRHDFGISNPFNTPCHISKPRLTANPIPSLVFSRNAY